MSEMPGFGSFFLAVYGVPPLPWQARLADRVVSSGWPDEIGVPTGLGKTACIDIAVWSLAAQSGKPARGRSVATRTWYVVNRRLLVDAAHERASKLARLLANPESLTSDRPAVDGRDVDVIGAVASGLNAIRAAGASCGPLFVARLRGGAELGLRSPEPSQPAVMLTTVPMYASRFLLRGYGTSSSMRPVDAALAGIDSLVLLDEAHLARALSVMADQAAGCDLGDPRSVLPAPRHRPRFVALTATGDRGGKSRFDLDADDHLDPIVRRRLSAPKPTQLIETNTKRLVESLAQAALHLTGQRDGSTCVVFCNTVKTARAVHAILDRSRTSDPEVWLVTGRRARPGGRRHPGGVVRPRYRRSGGPP